MPLASPFLLQVNSLRDAMLISFYQVIPTGRPAGTQPSLYIKMAWICSKKIAIGSKIELVWLPKNKNLIVDGLT